MKHATQSALRTLLIAAGLAVGVVGVLQFRADDWPIYLAYSLMLPILMVPSVEVLPRIVLAVADLATTIGFVYIGGLPIIVLRFFCILVVHRARLWLPASWDRRLADVRTECGPTRRELFTFSSPAGIRMSLSTAAEWSTFAVGLAVRWWIATWMSGGATPVDDAAAIAVAELAGQVCWMFLVQLPIYPDQRLMPLPDGEDRQTALDDIGLIVILAATPFVFLIYYGFQAHGLRGAVAWSLSSLGLHFVLKRLHERRLRVEEQRRDLEELNRELEHRERLSAIGKMSSIVSHQILQQLGVIGLHADLIRGLASSNGEPPELERTRASAAAIEGALGDVNGVLRDLLVFSRDLRLNLYEHRLDKIIGESVGDCRAQAEEQHVGLHADFLPEVELTADKLKLKQALTNIVRNAIEVSPTGSDVNIGATLHNGTVEITVADHGPGVPREQQEKIFTPFFTTKEHGTGLGLAIARVFVEAHGGQVEVTPQQNDGGARFRVRLPLSPDA